MTSAASATQSYCVNANALISEALESPLAIQPLIDLIKGYLFSCPSFPLQSQIENSCRTQNIVHIVNEAYAHCDKMQVGGQKHEPDVHFEISHRYVLHKGCAFNQIEVLFFANRDSTTRLQIVTFKVDKSVKRFALKKNEGYDFNTLQLHLNGMEQEWNFPSRYATIHNPPDDFWNRWDKKTCETLTRPLFQKVFQATLHLLGHPPSITALDLNGGDGLLAFSLLYSFAEITSCTLVDENPSSIESIQKRALEQGSEQQYWKRIIPLHGSPSNEEVVTKSLGKNNRFDVIIFRGADPKYAISHGLVARVLRICASFLKREGVLLFSGTTHTATQLKARGFAVLNQVAWHKKQYLSLYVLQKSPPKSAAASISTM
jgi:hypothetical protein